MTKQGKAPALIGIDLGTSSVKVLLTDMEGKILASHSQDYPTHQPKPGWFEQEPKDWWEAVVDSVKAVISGYEKTLDIQAMGLSGQMHGTLLLDANRHPLYPAIIWQDQRSSKQVEQINHLFSRSRLISITGSPAAAGFQVATICWIQQNRSDLWSQTAYILLPKDYLRLQLTGELASDPSDASGTLLFDINKRMWFTELIDRLKIDKDLLPPFQPSISVAGKLTPTAAKELGLPSGVPVITGGADTACAMLGACLVDPKKVLINISTGGQLVIPSWQADVDLQGRSHTFCSALEPQSGQAGWYRMGATLSAGKSLQWLRDNLLRLSGEDAYSQMTTQAAASPPGAHRLIFLPYLAGERTPHMDPGARGCFIGLTLQHQIPDLIRAVMEGVVFSLYEAYLTVRSTNTQPDCLILAGGGSRSRLWQQIVADVFNLPVLPLLVREQSALGAAMLAGFGLGLFSLDQALSSWARYGDVVKTDPRNLSLYASFFDLYRQAYVNLRQTTRQLSKIDAV